MADQAGPSSASGLVAAQAAVVDRTKHPSGIIPTLQVHVWVWHARARVRACVCMHACVRAWVYVCARVRACVRVCARVPVRAGVRARACACNLQLLTTPAPQNVVSTVNLGCKLDLKEIALHARNAEYNPKVRARRGGHARMHACTQPCMHALVAARGVRAWVQPAGTLSAPTRCMGAHARARTPAALRATHSGWCASASGWERAQPAHALAPSNSGHACAHAGSHPLSMHARTQAHSTHVPHVLPSSPPTPPRPQRFAAVIMRIREPKTTALIFASGKMVSECMVAAGVLPAAGRTVCSPLLPPKAPACSPFPPTDCCPGVHGRQVGGGRKDGSAQGGGAGYARGLSVRAPPHSGRARASTPKHAHEAPASHACLPPPCGTSAGA